MNYSVKFNGVELGEFIDVLQDFTPLSGADWSPEFLNTEGTRKGWILIIQLINTGQFLCPLLCLEIWKINMISWKKF